MNKFKKFAKALGLALLCMVMVNNAMAAVVTYYHNDISGTPIAATDAAGNLKWKESYKPYGDKLTRATASADNDIGFHGKAHDDSTGLSYMGARYYDPVLGRFMGVDPVDFQTDNLHSFNRYTYANNNPYKFIDPSGEYAELGLEVASLALGVFSFQKNVDAGNYGAAAVDAGGVAFDAVMSVIPFVPGLASVAVDAVRGGENIASFGKTLTTAENAPWTPVSFPSKLTKNSSNQIQADSTPQAAIDALKSNGYNHSTSKDGSVSILTNSQKTYRFYDKATSTGGPSAAMRMTGDKKDLTKIRFGSTP